MATEDLLVHNGRDGQTVEAVGEGFPQFDVVASLAFNKMLLNTDSRQLEETHIHRKSRRSC